MIASGRETGRGAAGGRRARSRAAANTPTGSCLQVRNGLVLSLSLSRQPNQHVLISDSRRAAQASPLLTPPAVRALPRDAATYDGRLRYGERSCSIAVRTKSIIYLHKSEYWRLAPSCLKK